MNDLLPKNWLRLPPENLANIAPIQQLNWGKANDLGIRVSIKREDLIDPIIGGNKIYKLYGHLQSYLKQYHEKPNDETLKTKLPTKKMPIASFGGAYSNHLYALAGICKELNIPLIAIIRGEKPLKLSPTLYDIESMGAKLHFISRQDYRNKDHPDYLASLKAKIGNCHWIPEGGGGIEALIGCEALGQALAQTSATTIVHACGTGASLAGIMNGIGAYKSRHHQRDAHLIKILGISALKSDASILKNIFSLTDANNIKMLNWRISNQFHHGGYAKINARLLAFIQETETQLNLPLDPIYTGKTMLAIDKLLEQGVWKAGEHIILVHSGGLQGAR